MIDTRFARHSGAIAAGACALALWLCAAPAPATTIQETLTEAYRTNPELKAAVQTLRATNELHPQALGSWLPDVSASGDATLRQVTQPQGSATLRYGQASRGAQVGFTQPITRGGAEFAQLRQAENRIRQQRALLVSTEQRVLQQAAEAHVTALANRQIVEVRRGYRNALGQLIDLARRQLNLGDRTLADVSQAEARAAQADAELAAAEADRDNAEALYRQVVGTRPDRLRPAGPAVNLPPGLDAVEDLAWRSSPPVIAAAFGLEAAADEVDVRTGGLLPRLSLEGTVRWDEQRYTLDGFPSAGHQRNASIGMRLTIPLYQSGIAESQVRAAKYRAGQARMDLDAARSQAIRTAVDAYNRHRSAAVALKAVRAQVAAATVAVNQLRRQVDAGFSTIPELLTAQRDLIESQVSLARTEGALVTTSYEVLAAVGSLTARSLELPIAYYDVEGEYTRTRWRLFGLSVE
ncbi:outer membrane factor (plasmid) [Azospirillum sp. B510]|uniref:TolC family outer membrane protein n=1 Tax=Azospirillum sp. (strain B510) TaxID=137722 RepID=UPI0001C4BC76|nr:TolC family outer membrane protein [Azospirillum sp. B510]BAI74502.1 outer membrane factor [Azospirillum sp. B510]